MRVCVCVCVCGLGVIVLVLDGGMMYDLGVDLVWCHFAAVA